MNLALALGLRPTDQPHGASLLRQPLDCRSRRRRRCRHLCRRRQCSLTEQLRMAVTKIYIYIYIERERERERYCYIMSKRNI